MLFVTRRVQKKLSKLLAKKLSERGHRILLLTSIVFSLWVFGISFINIARNGTPQNILGEKVSKIEAMTTTTLISPVVSISQPTETPTPTNTPTPTPFPPTPTRKTLPQLTATPTQSQNPTGTNSSQYTAQKVNDVTWKVSNVQNDDKMANASEVFNALNSYRQQHGASVLSWDTKLADFAKSRADTFAKNGSLDSHAGFTSYMNNGGFDASGFNGLGENSAFISGPMSGDKIIRSIFGADPSHDGNQLDPSWTHAGVGVNGNAINVNFGKNKR